MNKSLVNALSVFLLLCLMLVSDFLLSNGEFQSSELEGILLDLFKYEDI